MYTYIRISVYIYIHIYRFIYVNDAFFIPHLDM